MRVVTVIIGAGASYGLTPYEERDEVFRPPLTVSVFSPGPAFASILHEYTRVAMLATQMEGTTEDLETTLRVFEEQAKTHSHIARQFIQVPPYLNHLFGVVTEKFARRPREYIRLVDLALRHTEKVLFISLNYDALLEWPLVDIESIIFSHEDDYVRHSKWALLKLHGSCNWYHPIHGLQAVQVSPGHYLDALNRSDYPPNVGAEFICVGVGGHAKWFLGEKDLLYPALTVPIDGHYKTNCPDSHIEVARGLLLESEGYLIIGSSLRDADLLDLLKKNASPGIVQIVGGSTKGALEAGERLAKAVPQMPWESSRKYPNGFAAFVAEGQLEAFFKGTGT